MDSFFTCGQHGLGLWSFIFAVFETFLYCLFIYFFCVLYGPCVCTNVVLQVLVAIMGQKKRGYLVGLRQRQEAMVPRFDSNNIVLVEDNGTPTGTRIRVPIPSYLRGKKGDFTKILAIATKFV